MKFRNEEQYIKTHPPNLHPNQIIHLPVAHHSQHHYIDIIPEGRRRKCAVCADRNNTFRKSRILGVLPVSLAYALAIVSSNCMQDRKNELHIESTCYVNQLSKLSIIFKEWRVIVLFVLIGFFLLQD